MLIGRQRHLTLAVRSPGPRPLDPNPAATQGHLTRLMAVTNRGPIEIVAALRPDDLLDLLFHQLRQHTEPDTDAEREQTLLRCPNQLAQSLLHTRRQDGLRSEIGRASCRGSV